MSETKGTYSLTRMQAEKIVDHIRTIDGTMYFAPILINDIQRILDENQSLPPLAPFVWHDATPENCARIKDAEVAVRTMHKLKYFAEFASGEFKDVNDNGIIADVEYFMLIEL